MPKHPYAAMANELREIDVVESPTGAGADHPGGGLAPEAREPSLEV